MDGFGDYDWVAWIGLAVVLGIVEVTTLDLVFAMLAAGAFAGAITAMVTDQLVVQVLVALVTPFTADGEVDWAGVEKHMDDVIVAGADGIVVTGTTGETSTLTDPEKIKLVEVGRSVSAGRAKIITGGGSNETAHAMQLARQSEKAGADGKAVIEKAKR